MDLSLEPWMMGDLVGVDPTLAAVLNALQQVREDVRRWTEDFSDEEIWQSEDDVAPVGWQIRHLAGSIERLISYADGRSLSELQLADLRAESEQDASLQELLDSLETALVKAEALIRTTSPEEFGHRRAIGRKQIPTTVIGLLVHTAEHSQRHVGELIVAAKLVKLRRRELTD